MRLALALAMLLAGWAGSATAELGTVLDRVARAYGEASPPATIRQSGRTLSQMRGEGPLLRAWGGAERFRIEIHYPGGEEIRIVDGLEAWQGAQPMSGPFRGALLLQAARVALPWNLLAARQALRDGGEQRLEDGRTLHRVDWPLDDGLHLVVEIDPESGLIARSQGILAAPDGSQMPFGTVYEDYRRIGGRTYAAVEHHFAMNRYIGTSTIEAVEFDVPLPAQLFRPPAAGSR